MTRKIKIFALILALSLLFTGCGAADVQTVKEQAAPEEQATAETAETVPEETGDTGELPQQLQERICDALPEYVHYDPTSFYALLTQLEELGATEPFASVQALYEEAYGELTYVLDLATAASIRYCEDVTDEGLQEEQIYCDDLLVEMEDRFLIACKAVAEGPVGEDFRTYLGNDDFFEAYRCYEALTEEEKELYSGENSLVMDYYSLMDRCDTVEAEYNGKTYTLSFFETEKAERLYYRNTQQYWGIYQACLDAVTAEAGQIFLQLLEIRNRMAQLYGYDNYADYADELIYYRDYDSYDLQVLYDACRSVGTVFDEAYNYVFYEDPDSEVTAEELLTNCGSVLREISPVAEQWYEYMLENRLISVGDGDTRIDGARTCNLFGAKSAYIIDHTYGTLSDYTAIAHEFGHFTANNLVPCPNFVLCGATLDVQEIQSTGIQMLFSNAAAPVYGENTEYMQAYDLTDMLGYVVEGCLYDEWQRAVYTQMPTTVEELCDLYKEIALSYGIQDYWGIESAWIWVDHNFEFPMYYVSYATSGFAALQIWDRAQTDPEGAAALWETAVNLDPYTIGYCRAVEEMGLKLFCEEDTAEKILQSVATRLEEAME